MPTAARPGSPVTQVVEGAEAIPQLAREWAELAGSSPVSIYSTPDWYLAWQEAYLPARISIITTRRDGRLTGVLPLSRTRTDSRGLYFTRLAPIALGDYQPLIVDPGDAAETIPLLLDAAFDRLGRRGTFWWPHIPVDDQSYPILQQYLRDRRMPWSEDRELAPRASLEGKDFAAAEQMWTGHHRKDVRRQRKRLSEKGAVVFWQPSTLEDTEVVLQEFFEVHDQKWIAQGVPGKFQDPRSRRLFVNLARRFWNKGLHFSTVRCGEVHVSYHFGFVSGGWLHWYRPTYRADWGGFSPSKIHIAMAIEQVCDSGGKGIDFLLGDEPYKLQWTDGQNEVVNFHAGFHRYAPSYLWFAHGKPWVRGQLLTQYYKLKAWAQRRRSTPPQ